MELNIKIIINGIKRVIWGFKTMMWKYKRILKNCNQGAHYIISNLTKQYAEFNFIKQGNNTQVPLAQYNAVAYIRTTEVWLTWRKNKVATNISSFRHWQQTASTAHTASTTCKLDTASTTCNFFWSSLLYNKSVRALGVGTVLLALLCDAENVRLDSLKKK